MVAIVRKHWIIFASALASYAFLALLPFVLLLVGYLIAGQSSSLAPLSHALDNVLASGLTRVGLGLWWLVLWLGVVATFTRLYLDVWVLTTDRIVEVRQRGYFNRHLSSFFLSRIQNISTDVSGILGTMLRYGSIHVETAGDAPDFEMNGIRDPQTLRDLIIEETDEIHRNHPPTSDAPDPEAAPVAHTDGV